MFYLLLKPGPESLRTQLPLDVHWHLLPLNMISHLVLGDCGGARIMPLILAVHLYVYFCHYKKIINKYIPDLPRWFKCFKLHSVTQKPQSVSDLNDFRASEIYHVLWSKIKKEMLKAPGNLKGIAAKSNRNAHRPASAWVMSGTEVHMARKKDSVSSEYSWTTATIKISTVKGRWTQGTFPHSFGGCCCCYSPFPAQLCGWARIQNMQIHMYTAEKCQTSTQINTSGRTKPLLRATSD